MTVRAASDADANSGSSAIAHTPSGGGYDNVSFIALTVTEGEPPVKLRNSADDADLDLAAALSVPEGSTSSSNYASYKVKLSSQPSGNVTVYLDLQSTSGNNAGDASINRSPSSLTFTTQNWNTAQEVKVWAGEDSDSIAGFAYHLPPRQRRRLHQRRRRRPHRHRGRYRQVHRSQELR